jgi:hypothetical protein
MRIRDGESCLRHVDAPPAGRALIDCELIQDCIFAGIA